MREVIRDGRVRFVCPHIPLSGTYQEYLETLGRRENLPQGHRAEARVLPGQIELCFGQVPGLENPEVLGPETGELIEQRVERTLCVPRTMAGTIIRLEATVWTLRENDAGARHPIGFLTIDQMADVVEGTEGLRPLRAASPRRTDLLQERA